jgi:hypothetical protein
MIGAKISTFKPRAFGSSVDTDAAAFFTAAGITDATQKSAVNTLVVGLKANSLWTKFNAIYPMVGGTATTHKFNLKNPVDSDAAFRLSFSGGWTHSSTGALPNGTNGFADTFLTPSTTLSLNSTHLSIYSRTQTTSGAVDMGCTNGTTSCNLNMSFTNFFYANINNFAFATTLANAVTQGFFIGNRRASNVENGFKAGTKIIETATASTSLPNRTIYLGARNDSGTAAYYSNRQIAFATVGSGITDSEAATFSTLVQTYQTSLSRQV